MRPEQLLCEVFLSGHAGVLHAHAAAGGPEIRLQPATRGVRGSPQRRVLRGTDGQTGDNMNRRTSHSGPLLHTYRVGGVVVLVDVCIHHLLGENVRSLEGAALVASLHSLQ